MQLAACGAPREPLAPAPISSLCPTHDGNEWLGYWSVEGDGYFLRCHHASGETRWFEIVDSSPAADPTAPDALTPRRSTGSGVRPSAYAVHSRQRHTMLVLHAHLGQRRRR